MPTAAPSHCWPTPEYSPPRLALPRSLLGRRATMQQSWTSNSQTFEHVSPPRLLRQLQPLPRPRLPLQHLTQTTQLSSIMCIRRQRTSSGILATNNVTSTFSTSIATTCCGKAADRTAQRAMKDHLLGAQVAQAQAELQQHHLPSTELAWLYYNPSNMSCTHLGVAAGEGPLGSTPALPGRQTQHKAKSQAASIQCTSHKYLQHPGTALLQSLLLFGQSSVLRTGFCAAPLQVCKLLAQNLRNKNKHDELSSNSCANTKEFRQQILVGGTGHAEKTSRAHFNAQGTGRNEKPRFDPWVWKNTEAMQNRKT